MELIRFPDAPIDLSAEVYRPGVKASLWVCIGVRDSVRQPITAGEAVERSLRRLDFSGLFSLRDL